MTTPELSEALDAIERQAPEAVYAGRKGVTIGHSRHGKGTIMFRRTEGIIVAEYWPISAKSREGIKYLLLTPELAQRAERLMDR